MKNEIIKTTDYDQFKKLQGNRPLNNANLKRIMRSILEINLLRENPIRVNEHMQVIDGMHRLEVARMLDIPVYYTIMEGAALQDVIRLNTNLKAWTGKDFLESHIALGNQNYNTLQEFMTENKLQFTVALGLLSGRKISEGGSAALNEIFRKGEFVVVNKAFADDMADYLKILSEYCDDSCYRARNFVAALQNTLEKTDFKNLIKQLDASKIRLHHKQNIRDYLVLFEEILNFGKSTPIHLY